MRRFSNKSLRAYAASALFLIVCAGAAPITANRMIPAELLK